MSLTKSELYNFINANPVNGESTFDIWKYLNPNGTEEEFIQAIRGKSALEFWLELDVNAGKTEQDFLDWLGTDNSELIDKEITDREAAIIQVLLDAKAYADEKVNTETLAREAADTDILNTSKAYTDEKLDEEILNREAADTEVLNAANLHTDNKVAEEVLNREAADASTLADAKAYTNTKIEAEEAARIAVDEANLSTAKEYTDSQVSIEVLNREAAITQVLTDSKSYVDSQISNIVSNNETTNTETISYVDNKFTEEISLREVGDANTLNSANIYSDTKLVEAKSYTDDVFNTHNVAEDAHADIRELISGLTTRLHALADSDDVTLDQMSEVVAYIKANKELIESVTTAKVSVTDIIDNLTTNVANKPLSAAQGVVLKGLIDTLTGVVESLQAELEVLSSYSHIVDVTELPTAGIDEKLTYRVINGTFILDKVLRHDSNCYVVDELPTESIESVFVENGTVIAYNGYYNITDNTLYGYFDSNTIEVLKNVVKNSNMNSIAQGLANAALNALSTGWKTMEEIINLIKTFSDLSYGGIITSMDKVTGTGLYLLLENKMFFHKNGQWISSSKGVGFYGIGSSAEVFNDMSNVASGDSSHAEGKSTTAVGNSSHTEGYATTANGETSHAEGDGSISNGYSSHAEGYHTTTNGDYSHSEGNGSSANGAFSHAEGGNTIADAEGSHAEGGNTTASGYAAHAEGYNTIASGEYSHAEGNNTKAIKMSSHAEGQGTQATSEYAHAEGFETIASGLVSHAEGMGTIASAPFQHVQGKYNIEIPEAAFIIGNGTDNNNRNVASAIDWDGNAYFAGSIISNGAEVLTQDTLNLDNFYVTAGKKANTTLGSYSTAEGYDTTASGSSSHAEGSSTTASEHSAHAEGHNTTASGFYSHAEGYYTTASGSYSHAEGNNTTASGIAAHAEGKYTTASSDYQHVQGKYNIEDTEDKYSHIVGNGTSDTNRSNAHTLDWDGNAWFAGDIYTGGTSEEDGKKLATEESLTNLETTLTEKITEAVAGSVKDWNQHDETAADYIKNRTHYHIMSYGEIVPTTTVTLQYGGASITSPKFAPYPGLNYTVVWNGTTYECVAYSIFADGYERVIIGNSRNFTGVDSGEPFSLSSAPNADPGVYGYVSSYEEDLQATVTFSVTGEMIEIHKLDAMYLPDSLQKNLLDGNNAGSVRTIASASNYKMGPYAFAEGNGTIASGNCAHAEGTGSEASGWFSHAEGVGTEAYGMGSHAEGSNCVASGQFSHAEGNNTTASGNYSHAGGSETKASSHYQYVIGNRNAEDKDNKYLFIIGNGDSMKGSYANAHTVDWDGNAWFAKDVYIGGTSQDDSKKLATEEFVTNLIQSGSDYADTTYVDNKFDEAKSYTDTKISETLQSNYDLWLSLGYEGTPDDFIEFLRGDSAYEIWLKQEGNAGKTEEDFLNFLSGNSSSNVTATYVQLNDTVTGAPYKLYIENGKVVVENL